MPLRKLLPLAGVICLSVLMTGKHAAMADTIINIDPPGSVSAIAWGINSAGNVVGEFSNSVRGYGFIRKKDGVFKVFAWPGANTTRATAINDSGVTAGVYVDRRSRSYNFVRSYDGAFTSFSPSTRVSSGDIFAINASGSVVGAFYNQTDHGLVAHAFIRDPSGVITTFGIPKSDRTMAWDINSGGTVVGEYQDKTSTSHSFIRSPDGTVKLFDVPETGGNDAALAVNDDGWVSGGYVSKGILKTFLRSPSGALILYGTPGALTTVPSSGPSLNRAGTIAGYYQTHDFAYHAFIKPYRQAAISFDYPGSITTQAYAINRSGSAVGLYSNADGTIHAFLRVP